MTQHPPRTGYEGGEQPPYGQPSYGQGYGEYRQDQQSPYNQGGAYNQTPYASSGGAQSYYGSNDQPYQQYGGDQYPPYGQAAPGGPPYQHQQAYGNEYPPPNYPPHQAGPAGPYNNEVNAFQPHHEQSYGAIDPSTGHPMPQGAEGERGLMGALAGGAAGAFGGHKMGGHGIIGGIGGAIAGSMMEDAYKKHRFEQKMHEGFTHSSKDIEMEDRCILVAKCENAKGHHHRSTLDLNDCLTNEIGQLRWARNGNFAASSRNIRLIDGGRVLEAEAGDGRGGWTFNRIDLDERIRNEDGQLAMI